MALIRETEGGWSAAAAAPSYRAFLEIADGESVDWTARPAAGAPDPAGLIAAAHAMLPDEYLACVAVDMPLAVGPVTCRRVADNAISRKFGAVGCSTHSPSPTRPGPISTTIRDGFAAAGFPLATAATPPGTPTHLLEVYPGPAMLRLLGSGRRVEYKVSRARKYWPQVTVAERREKLAESWRRIAVALSLRIDGLSRCLPPLETLKTPAALKGYEDALDALICAWVGSCYLVGATAYGDETAAIWIPS